MTKSKISSGAVHKLPADFKKVMASSMKAKATWEDITGLARNEWICWVESAKKMETRNHRIERTVEDLSKGKRCPCCWAGCPHRFT